MKLHATSYESSRVQRARLAPSAASAFRSIPSYFVKLAQGDREMRSFLSGCRTAFSEQRPAARLMPGTSQNPSKLKVLPQLIGIEPGFTVLAARKSFQTELSGTGNSLAQGRVIFRVWSLHKKLPLDFILLFFLPSHTPVITDYTRLLQ